MSTVYSSSNQFSCNFQSKEISLRGRSLSCGIQLENVISHTLNFPRYPRTVKCILFLFSVRLSSSTFEGRVGNGADSDSTFDLIKIKFDLKVKLVMQYIKEKHILYALSTITIIALPGFLGS